MLVTEANKMAGVGVLDDVVSTDLVLQEWSSLETEYSHLEVSICHIMNQEFMKQGKKQTSCCRHSALLFVTRSV